MTPKDLAGLVERHDLRRWMRVTHVDGSFDYLRCHCGAIIREDSNEAMFGHVASALLDQHAVVEPQTDYARLSVMLYRSLERLSISIESCARIGFTESSPTTSEGDAMVWQDLNDAQKDAKLKLKHYQRFIDDWDGITPAHAAEQPKLTEACERYKAALEKMMSPAMDWYDGEIGVGHHFRVIAREALLAAPVTGYHCGACGAELGDSIKRVAPVADGSSPSKAPSPAPPAQESDERRVEIWFDESPTQGSNRGFIRFRDEEALAAGPPLRKEGGGLAAQPEQQKEKNEK